MLRTSNGALFMFTKMTKLPSRWRFDFSAKGNHFSHDPFEEITQALNMSSKILFACLVCPDV
jgi:hypothetical protein